MNDTVSPSATPTPAPTPEQMQAYREARFRRVCERDVLPDPGRPGMWRFGSGDVSYATRDEAEMEATREAASVVMGNLDIGTEAWDAMDAEGRIEAAIDALGENGRDLQERFREMLGFVVHETSPGSGEWTWQGAYGVRADRDAAELEATREAASEVMADHDIDSEGWDALDWKARVRLAAETAGHGLDPEEDTASPSDGPYPRL